MVFVRLRYKWNGLCSWIVSCFLSWMFMAAKLEPPWSAKKRMYLFSRRGHEESLALFILALITVSESLFCLASRYALTNPNFNFCSKRVRPHTHARVNCATWICGFSKYNHSVRGVINNPERIDKSEATISMRLSFFMILHVREHVTTVIIEAPSIIIQYEGSSTNRNEWISPRLRYQWDGFVSWIVYCLFVRIFHYLENWNTVVSNEKNVSIQ